MTVDRLFNIIGWLLSDDSELFIDIAGRTHNKPTMRILAKGDAEEVERIATIARQFGIESVALDEAKQISGLKTSTK